MLHVEVLLDKTTKPRSSAGMYLLAAVQNNFPKGVNKVSHNFYFILTALIEVLHWIN